MSVSASKSKSSRGLLLAIVSAIPAMAGVIWMWFATGCLGFASLYTWMSRANVIDDLPKKIARKCSFLSNGLRDPGGSADERFQRLSEEFDDYDRVEVTAMAAQA